MHIRRKLKKFDALVRVRKLSKTKAEANFHTSLSKLKSIQEESESAMESIEQSCIAQRDYLETSASLDPQVLSTNLNYIGLLQNKYEEIGTDLKNGQDILEDSRQKLVKEAVQERISKKIYANARSNYLSAIAQKAMSDLQ